MIYIVAAIAKNNVIGRNNKLPWHYPEDLKGFLRITKNKSVIMGRKTHESIGRPLNSKGRTNIVLSSDPNYKSEGCIVVNSLEKAIEIGKEKSNDVDMWKKSKEVCIVGGQAVYEEALEKDLVDKLLITHIDEVIEDGDAFFPEIDMNVWQKFYTYHNPPSKLTNRIYTRRADGGFETGLN